MAKKLLSFNRKFSDHRQQDLLYLEHEEIDGESILADSKEKPHNGDVCVFGNTDFTTGSKKKSCSQNFSDDNDVSLFKTAEKISLENHFLSRFSQDNLEDSELTFLSMTRKTRSSDPKNTDDLSADDSDNQDIYDRIQCSPIVQPTNFEHATSYNEKLMRMLRSICQLEADFADQMNLLEEEKLERLKIQKEMCQAISNDPLNDKNDLLFLNLCKSEGSLAMSNAEKNICSNKTIECEKNQDDTSNKKDFIHRNIELATKAMSKLPLTDEEKRQLDKILSDIDEDAQNAGALNSQDATTNQMETDDTVISDNAFHLSETDKQRISAIDLELENDFWETRNLRSSSYDSEDFWKSLILDQSLKKIDEKLATLKEKDEQPEEVVLED